MIQFAGTAVFIKDEVRSAPLRRTFHLQPEELSNGGKGYLLIDSAEFERTPLFVQAEWALFAIIELQGRRGGTRVIGKRLKGVEEKRAAQGKSLPQALKRGRL